MKQWYALYVSLYSYEVVIWPDCFVGYSSPGGICPRIWPLAIDMQHYYHAMYPTDDWHLACMFSLVYFSVEVCLLVGVFLHSVSIWSDPCVRACVPLMNWRRPSRENTIVQGVTQFSTWAKRGGIWTDARVCLHYWVVIWVAGFCNPPPPLILHSFWGMS